MKRNTASAAEAEQAVLGALLLDAQGVHAAGDLPAHVWSTPRHAAIYDAIARMVGAGDAVDVFTVADAVGHQQYIIQLAAEAPGSANAAAYAEMVRRCWRIRQALCIAADLRDSMGSGDEAGIDTAISSLMGLQRTQASAECTLRDALGEAFQALQRAATNPGALRGVTTGLADLDAMIGGLHAGDLIVFGARPAMGKTAAMLSMASASSVTMPIGIISGEQPRAQVAQRMLAQASSVAASKMRTGQLDDAEWARLTAGMHKLLQRNVMIYDRSAPEIGEVARVARMWKHKHGIKALYVDYIQRIRAKASKDAKRFENVGMVAQELKNLARDLDIPVFALAQVNRQVEARQDKRPSMGDLADSSDIEKEADIVMMLYRDEVYNRDTKDAGIAEISIEKNRHGPNNLIMAAWIADVMRFADLSRGYDSSDRNPH